MGIKHFFTWYKNQFSSHIKSLKKDSNLTNINISIDNLMLDMNGIYHNSAQKIYQYGNYKPPKRLLTRGIHIPITQNNQTLVFKDICETVDQLLRITKPRKKIVLCVDGVAPRSKQNQQRSRRFRSACESSSDVSFDSNSITPGTLFMDKLSQYIDWYIRKKISNDPAYRNIEIIFSDEKAPGEGEQKCVSYIRDYGDPNESYCINGLDADLIMLTLATHIPKFYIIREDLYDPSNDYFCIDVGGSRDQLIKELKWKSKGKHRFSSKRAIDDFVFLCFIVGNDFLPHIPSIEIIEKGIELIIEIYKEIGTYYGHITQTVDGKIKFISGNLGKFLGTIGKHEKVNFERKLARKASFFPDEMLERHARQDSDGKWNLDINAYNEDYCQTYYTNADIEKVCHEYLEGMQWVLSYYTRGVPNWQWFFQYHYAPPASVLAEHIDTFKFVKYSHSVPTSPFIQLLSVLPPKSASLIPQPLCNLLTSESTPLKSFYPEEFEIDIAGKRKEWEGIAILPIVDLKLLESLYYKYIGHVNDKDNQRNIKGKTIIYKRIENQVFLDQY
jgi:5'-3' exonuclease